jgi:hypothetical protein
MVLLFSKKKNKRYFLIPNFDDTKLAIIPQTDNIPQFFIRRKFVIVSFHIRINVLEYSKPFGYSVF